MDYSQALPVVLCCASTIYKLREGSGFLNRPPQFYSFNTMIGTLLRILALAAFATPFVTAAPAQVTVLGLFNPVSTAVPATILGVDSQGHTTYVIEQDEMRGSSIIAQATETVVEGEGSDYMSLTLSSPPPLQIELGFECSLEGANAICSQAVSGSQEFTTTIATSFFQQIVVDVTSTPTPTPTSTPTSTTRPNSSQRLGIQRSISVLWCCQWRTSWFESLAHRRCNYEPRDSTAVPVHTCGLATGLYLFLRFIEVRSSSMNLV
ncbi:hypothetical protein DFH07DRAFT_149314 [Mycena maculata]|uniref:Uncharacterized protein n=1 Tax=Mycena maculata TaxID=230809 RepID=A0AAD7JVU4_9AGAR|nr:hypothetical protein DFH07DRAFT_149314 [Mycena maculata]